MANVTAQRLETAPRSIKLVQAAAEDYPGKEIRVSFPDEWMLVERLEAQDRRLYVARLPVSQERPRRDHFYGLSSEINLSLTAYRHYKLFAPQLVPTFQMAWYSHLGQGRIIGTGPTYINLREMGQAQVWHGDREAVLWECYGFAYDRPRPDWLATWGRFWQAVERDLPVSRILTPPIEPTFQENYPDFLGQQGYAPDPSFARWWSRLR